MAGRKGSEAIRLAVNNAETFDGDGKGGPLDLRLAHKPLNDIGNGERFRQRYGRNFMFVPEAGRYFYTGARWSGQIGSQEWALAAHKTAQTMLRREAAELEAELDGGDEKRLRAFRDWAVRSGNREKLDAMQAVSEPVLTKRLAELDADPLLFNVQNGTLDLRAAVRLRRHARRDLITRISPLGYDPDAQCPLFRAFLDQIMPDREVQRWLQRFLGYSITGLAGEHILALLLGEGRNGKGTLVRLFLWLYGDYAATISFASLAADNHRRGGEPSPDIARLPGIRLLFAAEPRKGVRLDDGRIKELTGEDRQVARHLNREFFEFDPQFKLAIQANNKPRISDSSRGMWARVRLVPFNVTIPPELIDQDLLSKLKAEGPGVLNWALDGFRLWREEGLVAAPQAIMAATTRYRGESDEIGRFLATATAPNKEGSVASALLYQCYAGWATAMELRPVSRTKFGTELTERGHPKEKRGSERTVWRLGLSWRLDDIDWEWEGSGISRG